MILDIGEKVHIIDKRQYKEDVRHHFIGEVVRATDNSIRVFGYVWSCEAMKGFYRKPEKRERVVTLYEGLIINIIPPEVNLEEIKYVSSLQKGHFVTDGKKYVMDITEFVVG
jgi:hypothetical protein